MPAKKARVKQHIVNHNDGTIWGKGQMLNGVATRYWEWFRKDRSKMRSGYFDSGEQVGEWTTYDRTGKVFKVTVMKAEEREEKVRLGRNNLKRNGPSDERVEHRDARLLEIADVMRGNGQAVRQGSRGNHAVQDRELVSFLPQIGNELCPAPANGHIPRQTFNSVHHRVKPSLELSASSSVR